MRMRARKPGIEKKERQRNSPYRRNSLPSCIGSRSLALKGIKGKWLKRTRLNGSQQYLGFPKFCLI